MDNALRTMYWFMYGDPDCVDEWELDNGSSIRWITYDSTGYMSYTSLLDDYPIESRTLH